MDVIKKEFRVLSVLLSAGSEGMHAYGIIKALSDEEKHSGQPCPSQTTIYNILTKYRKDGWLDVEHMPQNPIAKELPKSIYRMEKLGFDQLDEIVNSTLDAYTKLRQRVEDARERFKRRPERNGDA